MPRVSAVLARGQAPCLRRAVLIDRARRRRERRTRRVAVLAAAATGGLAALELRHLRRTRSPHVGTALQAARQGYQAGSTRENAVFNMLVAFLATFGGARAVTRLIRHGVGPFGNVVVGRRHIHHFVPGIVIALAAGGVSIGVRRQELDKWLALPFGAGAALVLDEAALLLELEDVYWSHEGAVSIQITLGAAALLGFLGLAARLLRRGEPLVVASGEGPS